MIICRIATGNPKKNSYFICLKCGEQNHVLDGIQRIKQREKYHIKDAYCCKCDCETKNVEIRYCDWYDDIKAKVPELHTEYYIDV